MKTYLVNLIGQHFVDRISLTCQFVLLIALAASFYESRALGFTKHVLAFFGRFQKFFWYGKWGFGIGNSGEARARIEDFGIVPLTLSAAVIVSLAVLSGHGAVYWISLPIRRLISGVTVWYDISLQWRALLVLLSSIGNFVLGLFQMLLIYAGGFGIPIRAALVLSDWLHGRLSAKVFHAALFVVCIFAGLIVALTSADWF